MQIVEAIAACESQPHQGVENQIFQLMLHFVHSQLVDLRNGQIQKDSFDQSQDYADLINILFGNPTLNLKRYMDLIDGSSFTEVQ